MKKKCDVLVYLEDILESAELIESYVVKITEGEFYLSRKAGCDFASLADYW